MLQYGKFVLKWDTLYVYLSYIRYILMQNHFVQTRKDFNAEFLSDPTQLD